MNHAHRLIAGFIGKLLVDFTIVKTTFLASPNQCYAMIANVVYEDSGDVGFNFEGGCHLLEI